VELVKNVLSWFEIPVTDFERARAFYSQIFDFDMPKMQMGANMMGFFLMDQNAGGIGGAICQGQGYVPAQNGTLVYLNGGSDLNIVLNRVEKAGGKIVLPKTLINPELGFFAIFIDSEGNKVALHSMK
jgi:predicted enzyme related to lactoylglutathione lyase